MRLRRFVVVVVLGLSGSLMAVGRAEAGAEPRDVVRVFCREDALGARAEPRTYGRVASLVMWPLEPAWDHAALVAGFEVGDPQPIEPGVVDVPVSYSVVGRVSSLRYDVESFLERRVFRVLFDDGVWRISGPPPAPHLFENRVEPELLQQAFRGASGYLSQSRFVAEVYRAAGWQLPVETVGEMSAGATWVPLAHAAPGDVVLFLDDGEPYHTGVLEARDQVISATLQAGLMRSTLATFPGEVRYLRLLEGAPTLPAPAEGSSSSRSGVESQLRETTESSSAPTPPAR